MYILNSRENKGHQHTHTGSVFTLKKMKKQEIVQNFPEHQLCQNDFIACRKLM